MKKYRITGGRNIIIIEARSPVSALKSVMTFPAYQMPIFVDTDTVVWCGMTAERVPDDGEKLITK